MHREPRANVKEKVARFEIERTVLRLCRTVVAMNEGEVRSYERLNFILNQSMRLRLS